MNDTAPAVNQPPLAAGQEETSDSNDADTQRIKILIAEDNVVNQLVLTKMLDSARYDFTIAENGAIAVEKFQQTQPQLIVMDVSMPVMDGYEATRKIRTLEKKMGPARTPIIAATAHILPEDRAKCLEVGMDDFISKPMRKQTLDETLDKWTRGDKADSDDALSA